MSWRLGRSLHQGRGRRPRWLRRVALAGLLIALAGGGWVLARARESHEEALERQGGLGRVHAAAGPGADQRAVVWALGDGADGSPQAQRLAERIGRGRVDRFLYLGDVYENGTGDEFEDNFAPVYERLGRVTSPTPGNHDWPRHEEGYGPYWSRVQGRAPPSYYALSLGGWTLLSLNSEEPHGPGRRSFAGSTTRFGAGEERAASPSGTGLGTAPARRTETSPTSSRSGTPFGDARRSS